MTLKSNTVSGTREREQRVLSADVGCALWVGWAAGAGELVGISIPVGRRTYQACPWSMQRMFSWACGQVAKYCVDYVHTLPTR